MPRRTTSTTASRMVGLHVRFWPMNAIVSEARSGPVAEVRLFQVATVQPSTMHRWTHVLASIAGLEFIARLIADKGRTVGCTQQVAERVILV